MNASFGGKFKHHFGRIPVQVTLGGSKGRYQWREEENSLQQTGNFMGSLGYEKEEEEEKYLVLTEDSANV